MQDLEDVCNSGKCRACTSCAQCWLGDHAVHDTRQAASLAEVATGAHAADAAQWLSTISGSVAQAAAPPPTHLQGKTVWLHLVAEVLIGDPSVAVDAQAQAPELPKHGGSRGSGHRRARPHIVVHVDQVSNLSSTSHRVVDGHKRNTGEVLMHVGPESDWLPAAVMSATTQPLTPPMLLAPPRKRLVVV